MVDEWTDRCSMEGLFETRGCNAMKGGEGSDRWACIESNLSLGDG